MYVINSSMMWPASLRYCTSLLILSCHTECCLGNLEFQVMCTLLDCYISDCMHSVTTPLNLLVGWLQRQLPHHSLVYEQNSFSKLLKKQRSTYSRLNTEQSALEGSALLPLVKLISTCGWATLHMHTKHGVLICEAFLSAW